MMPVCAEWHLNASWQLAVSARADRARERALCTACTWLCALRALLHGHGSARALRLYRLRVARQAVSAHDSDSTTWSRRNSRCVKTILFLIRSMAARARAVLESAKLDYNCTDRIE